VEATKNSSVVSRWLVTKPIEHSRSRALLTVVALLASASLPCIAEKLVPAGSLIQCTVSENKLSSKTVAIGDPVLCHVSRSSIFPSGTVLSGTFEDYKDPGHLVGKGWMELVFDRMIFPSNEIVQLDVKVISVPHYSVDTEGKVLGKGHATRDAIEWLIPVLWPIDILNLPRRGPRPPLKNESRIVVKVMNDLVAPDMAPVTHNQYGFAQRPEPISYAAPQQQEGGQPVVIVFIHGQQNLAQTEEVSSYSYSGNSLLGVIRAPDGMQHYINMGNIDLTATVEANRQNGINFMVPGYQIGAYDSMADIYGNGSQYPRNGFKTAEQARNWAVRNRPR